MVSMMGDPRHEAWRIVCGRLGLPENPKPTEVADAMDAKRATMSEQRYMETMAVLAKLLGEPVGDTSYFITDWQLGYLYEQIDKPLFAIETL